ncbi:hypothetical protein [Nocardia brasiliensis]|uniref:hypothetical protein n=1 Tax=Nocardia brasiliensis TaxID=37326 RepID=UPI00366C7DF2
MTYRNPAVAAPAVPSGLVPKTAGVLALLVGLCNVWGARTLLEPFGHGPADLDNSLAIFGGLGGLLAAFALIYGAALMFRHDQAGRYTVLLASGVLSAIALVGLVCSLTGYQPDYAIDWFPAQGPIADPLTSAFGGLVGILTAFVHRDWVAGVAGLALPLAVYLLTSAHYTETWVEAGSGVDGRREMSG